MNKEQQEIILGVYREHQLEQSKYLRHGGTIQEFINKCKTDTEFSERWGLKIEEQTILEQVDQNNPMLKGSTALYPRKLITVTYNNKTIESYE